MFWKNKLKGRIFISYRRSDAQGVAGRLSDTLEDYFGDDRVFRDIEDISGGADFGEVIAKNLDSADAMIVLMGNDWLQATTEDGIKRLEAPNDWVSQEISAAIEKGIPVFPVLIEDTPMPREDELPDRLKPLLRFNALNVSDIRWEYDVQRLAKIISLDLPSANELKLEVVRFLISIGLTISLCFSAAMLAINYLKLRCEQDGLCNFFTLKDGQVTSLEFDAIIKEFVSDPNSDISNPPEIDVLYTNPNLLELWQAGVPYVFIIGSSLALFSVLGLIAKDKQRYIYASIGVGAFGSLLFFSIQIFQESFEEPVIGFFGAVLIVCLMFVLMNMSGFKAK